MQSAQGLAPASELVSESVDELDVVQTRHQLLALHAERRLEGRTLRGFSAAGVMLADAALSRVVIDTVDLQDVEADGAQLVEARFNAVDGRRSTWRGALWERVDAAGCDFTEIDLEGAHLAHCQLGPLRMGRARLREARLAHVRLSDVELFGADFAGAILVGVSFEAGGTASLTRAQLAGATLIECDLRNVNAYAASLAGALLIRCDLRGVNLSAAALAGARLVGCQTEGADVDGATS